MFLPAQEVVQFYYELMQGTVNTAETSDNSSDVSDSENEQEPEQIFDVYALHGDMEQKVGSKFIRKIVQICQNCQLRSTELIKRTHCALINLCIVLARVSRACHICHIYFLFCLSCCSIAVKYTDDSRKPTRVYCYVQM